MHRQPRLVALLTLLIVSLVATACAPGELPSFIATPPGWSAAAPTALPTLAPPTATPTDLPPTAPPTAVLPTAIPTDVPPTATATSAPALAQAVQPTATPTRRPTATPTRRPTATPTARPAWSAELVVTEQQISSLAGTTAVEGLTVNNLQVRFGNGTMALTADSIRYGFLTVRNLAVEGRLTVANGKVTFTADRIQPRNLATAAIPNIINQALNQSLGDWYVESLRVEPGKMTALVRPA